jgi:hypothetical protein
MLSTKGSVRSQVADPPQAALVALVDLRGRGSLATRLGRSAR